MKRSSSDSASSRASVQPPTFVLRRPTVASVTYSIVNPPPLESIARPTACRTSASGSVRRGEATGRREECEPLVAPAGPGPVEALNDHLTARAHGHQDAYAARECG